MRSALPTGQQVKFIIIIIMIDNFRIALFSGVHKLTHQIINVRNYFVVDDIDLTPVQVPS